MIVRLRQVAERGVRLTIVYGKTDLTSAEFEKLRSIKGIGVLFVPYLHAKCYYNEREMLVTSMNLHGYSAQNNHELGILFDRQADAAEYTAVQQELEVMFEGAVHDKELNTQGIVVTAPFEVEKALCIYWNSHFGTTAFQVHEPDLEGSRRRIERTGWPLPDVDFSFDGRCAQLKNSIPIQPRPAFQAYFNTTHAEPHFRNYPDNGKIPRQYAAQNRRLDDALIGFDDVRSFGTQGVEALVAEYKRAWEACKGGT